VKYLGKSATREWIEVHNEAHHNIRSLSSVIQSRRMRWVFHVARVGDETFLYNFGRRTVRQ
jgi:hypothetical protein